MKIVKPLENQLSEIHEFIKSQSPRYTRPLKRFLETESVENPRYNSITRVAVNEGEILGYMSLKDHQFAPSQMRVIKLWVKNCEHRKKIGDEFISLAEKNCSSPILSSGVFEDENWKIELFKEHGFTEHSQMWRSSMNPQEYNSSGQLSGVRIVSARELYAMDSNALRKFHQLELDVVSIIPAEFPMEPMSFEEFKEHKEKSGFDLDLSFFALDEEELIGLSTTMVMNDHAQVLLTGVLKSHQGKGIAFELKERAILASKERGYTLMSTMNDSVNTPMLSLNSKFGFKKETAVIRLDKTEVIS